MKKSVSIYKMFIKKISYGTVLTLCVHRNKRRCLAAQYRRMANVTNRRARKGF